MCCDGNLLCVEHIHKEIGFSANGDQKGVHSSFSVEANIQTGLLSQRLLNKAARFPYGFLSFAFPFQGWNTKRH
jgi:hypothetical protein